MTDDREPIVAELIARLLTGANEKKRLQQIVAYSQSPTLRELAIADLANIITSINLTKLELEKQEDAKGT